VIADADGNLFGTTSYGGLDGQGTVLGIARAASTTTGWAATPTILVSFGGNNGTHPSAGLTADAAGNLFGTTSEGGTSGRGTVFEVTASGFVPFAGRPRRLGCAVESGLAEARQQGVATALAAFGYPGLPLMLRTLANYCRG
jgi:uncharacterized repeat protein (TIGR03803 family)